MTQKTWMEATGRRSGARHVEREEPAEPKPDRSVLAESVQEAG